MRQKLFSFLLVAFAMGFVTSCTKIGPAANPNAKFAGTWNGSSRCFFSDSPDTTLGTATENIGVGTSADDLNIGAWFGLNTCYKAVAVLGTVNGNNFSIAPQNFLDNCGNSYLTGGSANLSAGGTLTMTTYITDVLNTTTCVFTGVKQ